MSSDTKYLVIASKDGAVSQIVKYRGVEALVMNRFEVVDTTMSRYLMSKDAMNEATAILKRSGYNTASVPYTSPESTLDLDHVVLGDIQELLPAPRNIPSEEDIQDLRQRVIDKRRG